MSSSTRRARGRGFKGSRCCSPRSGFCSVAAPARLAASGRDGASEAPPGCGRPPASAARRVPACHSRTGRSGRGGRQRFHGRRLGINRQRTAKAGAITGRPAHCGVAQRVRRVTGAGPYRLTGHGSSQSLGSARCTSRLAGSRVARHGDIRHGAATATALRATCPFHTRARSARTPCVPRGRTCLATVRHQPSGEDVVVVVVVARASRAHVSRAGGLGGLGGLCGLSPRQQHAPEWGLAGLRGSTPDGIWVLGRRRSLAERLGDVWPTRGQ